MLDPVILVRICPVAWPTYVVTLMMMCAYYLYKIFMKHWIIYFCWIDWFAK